MKNNRIFSYFIVALSYVFAILAGGVVLFFLEYESPYLEMLMADIAATVVIFIFSILFRNSSLYDPYWSVIPVLITIYWIAIQPQGNEIRQILVLAVVLIWSLRLTYNWIRSWPDLSHEDWRYKKLAADTGKFYWVVSFLGIHLFPTLIVFLGLLPVLPAVSGMAPLGFFDIAGTIICLSAVAIEYISDEQLREFKKSVPDKVKNMESGLWSVSRHPNYFGEIMFWFGLWVFVLSTGFIENLWTASGFISMILLFYFVSIPMMEKRLTEKKQDYEEYKKRVPALIPRIIRGHG